MGRVIRVLPADRDRRDADGDGACVGRDAICARYGENVSLLSLVSLGTATTRSGPGRRLSREAGPGSARADVGDDVGQPRGRWCPLGCGGDLRDYARPQGNVAPRAAVRPRARLHDQGCARSA